MTQHPTADEAAEAVRWAESDEPKIRSEARPQRGTPQSRDAVREMLSEVAEGDPESERLLTRTGGS